MHDVALRTIGQRVWVLRALRRSTDGRRITLQRIVTFEPANIPAQDFQKLAQNLKEIDAAEQRQIVLKKVDG